MRSCTAPTLSLLLISLLVLPALANAHVAELEMRKGKGGGGGGGGENDGASIASTGSVIPLAKNANNPACKPWYAVRDAIMGGIYHGEQNLLVSWQLN
jgi:hypothetical protein